MRFIRILTFVFVAGLPGGFWTCAAESVTKEAMLRDIARNVIVSGYRDLAEKCRALSEASEQLRQDAGSNSLERTRQAWRNTLVASARVRWLQTGPMAEREYLSSFYYSKILPNRIEEISSSSRALDEAHLAEVGAYAKGIFTLEYLLFEPPSPAAKATDAVPDPKTVFGTNVERRCQYVAALASDLQRKAQIVSDDWSGTNGVGKFIAGQQQTLNNVVNQLAQMMEKLAENHLNLALKLPTPVTAQMDRIEAARSRSAVVELAAILRGVHDAYEGAQGTGIDDYLRGLNAPLETRVEQQFQKAITSIESIQWPLEEAITGHKPVVEAAYQAVHELEVLLKVDLASALGVTITFTSGDGD